MGLSMRNVAIGALLLLGGMAIAFLLMTPYLTLGNGGGAALGQGALLNPNSADSGGTLQQARRITMLEHELERLKEAIALEDSGQGAPSSALALAQPAAPSKDTSVTIDLIRFLGVQPFFSGISWDPFYCASPYKTAWKDIDDATLVSIEEQLVAELRAELARLKGVRLEDIDVKKQYHAQGISEEDSHKPEALSVYTTDPAFPIWRKRLGIILSKYMIRGDGAMATHEACAKVKGKVWKPQDMGTPAVDCLDEADEGGIIKAIGYYALPNLSIRDIAHDMIHVGHCLTQLRDHQPSYGHWMRKERIFNPEWMTFPVDTPEQDAAVLLFDMLYERLTVFTRQYWMGVITMQNPFDMYSIQDIIFQTKPDLIIETGTANGGSALLWASILHLLDLENSKIVTLDITPPKWEGAGWGGVAREDPTKHPLWSKHVVFLQGGSTEAKKVEQVKAMAAGKKVMVLLDSGHQESHVTQEMDHYCPLVSPDCYCIVEDTKMSRWASTGPLESVKKFMAGKHGKDFTVDRARELLYSHHTMGYLKRKQPAG